MSTKPKSQKNNPHFVGHIKIPRIPKKKFDAMTNARKRVAIAKDVLLRLKLKKISQKRGAFLITKEMEAIFNSNQHDKGRRLYKGDGQSFVEENKCEVCAKGALVLAWVANFNKLKVGDIYDRACTDGIREIFPSPMRDAMESAFEYGRWPLSTVMKWIVKHKGDFLYNTLKYTDEYQWGEYVGPQLAPSEPPRLR